MADLNLNFQCHHRHDIPLPQTLLYCFTLSSVFVLSLYAFVPSSVRRLPRDHVLHIKWRAGVIFGVMLSGVGLYPWIFCQYGTPNAYASGSGVTNPSSPLWYSYIGISWQPWQDLQIVLHVVILYLGSLTCVWLKIYHNARILHSEKEGKELENAGSARSSPFSATRQLPILPKPNYLHLALKYAWIEPTIQSFKSLYDDEDHRWTMLRNLGIAPLAEEVIFRSCLLPPLLASRHTGSRNGMLSPTQASWIAPLFFGVAHLHHLYEKYRMLQPYQKSRRMLCQLLLGVVVQWSYTTLFGAYVSHVFVRTGSLLGVTLAHVVCNYMGLPDMSFGHPTSNLYGYRWFVGIVYLFGISLFILGFDSVLFPSESVLPTLLRDTYN